MLTIERLNQRLYGSKDTVRGLLRLVSLVNSTAGVGLLIYGYGFNLTTAQVSTVFGWLDLVFAVFVLIYLCRVVYSFHRMEYLRRTLAEAALIALLITNGISNYLFGYKFLYAVSQALELTSYTAFYEVVSTLFLMLLVGLEVTKASTQIGTYKLKPTVTFLLSFVLLILGGAGLLMLPAMTVIDGSMPALDALFTSTSAVCVTGLIVVDTATYFTFKGQLLILALIQLGGLGMISFATFVASILRQNLGLKHQYIIQGYLSSESLSSAISLLRRIVFLTLLIEALGAVAIFFTWSPEVQFDTLGEKIYFSVFHSISAFCNAGFSIYTNGLYEVPVRSSYVLHLIIAGIIILGGLGFATLSDVFSPAAMRERLEKPWKDWRLNSKITVYMAAALIGFGAVLFFLLERNNTLVNLNLTERLITAFFQSVTTRTAGFNTVDFSQLEMPTLVMMMFLMFVGASPGSTGGGIKTTTFLIIAISVISTMQGSKVISLAKRTIPRELLFKAFSVITFAASYNLISIFVLTITEPDAAFIQLMFEQVSAFGTVGLSTGITADLSPAGKLMIISSMYIGRVGSTTLALAISRQVISNAYKYPETFIMVG
jgi:trk system potassium uptake protein